MKIAVCGCSFSAVGQSSPGTHWSEILKKDYGFEVYNYALGASSNSYIRLQMEAALEINPDWVIINATTASRIEFPVRKANDEVTRYCLEDFKISEGDKAIMTFPLPLLLSKRWRYGDCPENKVKAIEQYTMELYSNSWKRQVDQWLLNGGLKESHDRNIKFSYDPWLLDKGTKHEKVCTSYDTMPDWFKKMYYIEYENSYLCLFQNYMLPSDQDPGYHLNDQAQRILADFYADRINSCKTR